MIKEIYIVDFKNYKKLFQNIFYALNSLAVINGDNQGRMWLDNHENPKTGVLVDNENSIYLVGKSNNSNLNKEIANLIFNEIFPKARITSEQFENTWVIYYDHEDWKNKIEQDMNIIDYLPLKRSYYLYKNPSTLKWEEFITDGYTIEFLNEEFFERKDLTNFNEITNYINKSWSSKEAFLMSGFGFCLVNKDNRIISWCISDWVTDEKTEIGVGTDENFRRRGYATLVVNATLNYCLKKNFKVGWHCSNHNIASQKTAEKVGFKLEKEYNIILGSFDKAYILWENTWYRGLFLNQPEEGIKYMKEFLKIKHPNAFQLYNYGLILVRADELKEALSTFLKVVTMDPDFIPELRDTLFNARKLKYLKKTEGWNELIKKLEES